MVTVAGTLPGVENTNLMGRSKFVGLFHWHTSGATNQNDVSNWAWQAMRESHNNDVMTNSRLTPNTQPFLHHFDISSIMLFSHAFYNAAKITQILRNDYFLYLCRLFILKNKLMKVVILAGGYGTRISEESHLRPKPMIEIGDKPILWHIMKIYSHYGYNDFIICCGYKHYVIKEWFADYYLHNSDISFDFTNDNKMTVLNTSAVEPWKVTLIDTGLNTMTGGRVKRTQKYV